MYKIISTKCTLSSTDRVHLLYQNIFQEEVVHLDKAIKRIDEATHSLNKMQRDLDQLAPVFEASKTDVQLRLEAVEACQKEYAAAKDRCKKQEQDIEGMQGPIEILKKEAQAEFEKVSVTIISLKKNAQRKYARWLVWLRLTRVSVTRSKESQY